MELRGDVISSTDCRGAADGPIGPAIVCLKFGRIFSTAADLLLSPQKTDVGLLFGLAWTTSEVNAAPGAHETGRGLLCRSSGVGG
jgi:hypothetical protein